MSIGGVIQMLSPQPTGLASAQDSDNRASYAFGGVTNTASQGYPVPPGYGNAALVERLSPQVSTSKTSSNPNPEFLSLITAAGRFFYGRNMTKTIHGRKGGDSSARTPTEQPADLLSVAKAKILLALGEGELQGDSRDSLFFWMAHRCSMLTARQISAGLREFRPGTQHQSYIQGLPGTENEISLNSIEVSSVSPWTRTLTNSQLSAVRLRIKWPSIFRQEDDGDVVGYQIDYAIDLQVDGGAFTPVLETSVSGINTSGYERSHRINLPPGASTWTVRLRKKPPMRIARKLATG
jgi:hypothetical protein